MHSVAQRVLSHIRRDELLHAGDRVGVAVSGGIDSVALLRLLLELRGELGIVLSVVHFNHKLRGAESEADQEFVAGLARAYDLEFFCDSDDVAQQAREEGISVETAARELRYGFFRHLLGEDGSQELNPQLLSAPDGAAESRGLSHPNRSLNKIATGHTLDDQAETVLMRMIRGAGPTGLAGIYPRITVEDDGEFCGEIVRPLLATRRHELEQYLRDIRQNWREDSSNTDPSFTRNRLRKLVVPLLEKEFNPAIAQNLAELAEIARGEEDYWENEVAGWMGTAVHWSEPEWVRAVSKPAELIQISRPGPANGKDRPLQRPSQDDQLRQRIADAPWLVMNASVDRLWFLGEPVAVQRRLIKAIGEQARITLEFKHVNEVLCFTGEDHPTRKELSLPQGWKLRCAPHELVFVTPDLRERPDLREKEAQDYEYELAIPGQVLVSEIGSLIEARLIPAGAEAGYNPDHLLDADSLSVPLRVRNWRAGDRFWPAHTKSPKKIKELLQGRHVQQPERKLWPVMVSGDEIVWLRGFVSPAKFRAKQGCAVVWVQETPVQETPVKETPVHETPLGSNTSDAELDS